MVMYKLIEYSDIFSKTSGSSWQHKWDESNNNIRDFESFEFKAKITGSNRNDGNTEDVDIAVPLEYFSNFWKSLEMPLINCKINYILTWSASNFMFQ